MTQAGMKTRRIILAIISDAARKRKRCPTNEELRKLVIARGRSGLSSSNNLSSMAYQGLLRVEVYGKNYRVVEIDGMRTKEYPGDQPPYLVIEKGKKWRY